VHPEGVQRIVVSDLLFEAGHREEPQSAGGQADEDRRSRPTNPAAGVMATKPATTPEAMPSTVGFLLITHSINIHARAAAAAEVLVTRKAEPAKPSATRALPALNPNQPNQSRAAPGP